MTRTAGRRSRWTEATCERTRRPRRHCERPSPARSRWTPVSARTSISSWRGSRPTSAAVEEGRLSEANALASEIEVGISNAGDAAGERAHQIGISAYASERRLVEIGRVGIALAFVVFGALWWMLRQQRRRLDEARRQEMTRLSEMASSDPLTGLRNHRVFHEDLARELQRTGRTGDPLALVLVDLDGLKTINDTHGHQVGDQRIKALADALLQSSRATDTAYRIGGDEFAVLLPGARGWGAIGVRATSASGLPGRDAGHRRRGVPRVP